MEKGEFKSSKEVTERLWDFERELDLFDIKIRNVFIWERIRYYVERGILEELDFMEDKFCKEPNLFVKKVVFMFRSIVHFIKELSLLLAPREILFIGKMVRKLDKRSFYWDILFDPILERLNKGDYLLIQPHYNYKYFNPPKTERLVHMGFVFIFSEFSRKILRRRIILTEEEKFSIKNIQESLHKEFGVNLDIYDKIKDELLTRKIEVPLFRILFKVLKPKFVIFQIGNIYHNIIEVCKEQGIVTIEMQHGAIGPYDVIYSYPEKIHKEHFADYLFVFGDYWRDSIQFPLPKEYVISVGNPYFDMKRREFSEITTKKDRILFLSQSTIGKKLSEFAASLAEEGIDYEILYKLHPDEYNDWRERFPAIARMSDSGKIKVVDSDRPSIYKLIAESKVQIGVYSTAIYEGLSFGLRTFLVDLPGIENMSNLIGMGYAQEVSDPKEVVEKISLTKKSDDINMGYFFKENAVDNILREIMEIKSKKGKICVKS